ncbi:MAG: MFS transporter [Saprospiraceae bacterium]|nr:MFS transporter [Saprospiraceae bacterium]
MENQTAVAFRPPLRVLILYALGQLGWSLAGFAVGNLLIYFYMPPERGETMFPVFLYQYSILGILTLVGILSAFGRLMDAFFDPFIANWSDRKASKYGKRRWFMLWGAIPFALMGFLAFCPPVASESASNFVWLAGIISIYYFFFAFYVIPYTALMAELGHTAEDRMLISTLTSLTWAVGFILGNSSYALQSVFQTKGFTATQSLQYALAILATVAAVFMLLPAFFLNEKKYARQADSEHSLRSALTAVFSSINFRWFLLSDLMYWLALTFVQLGVGFYTTLMLRLDAGYAFIFSLTGFLCSFLFYAPINFFVKKWGKKPMILLGFALFSIIFLGLSLSRNLPFSGTTLLYAMGGATALPLAIFGILPNAIIGDEVVRAEREGGQNLAGMYYGVRAFVMKVGISLANLLFPSLLLFGKSETNFFGVQMTAVAALVFCIFGWLVFRRYDEL